MMKTVASCETNIEAWIVRNFLATNDVGVVVNDEFVVSFWWFYGLLLGGIKIQVLERDEARARALLAENGRLVDHIAGIIQAAGDDRPRNPKTDPVCRRCGSEEIYRIRYSRSFAIWSWYLLGVPLPYPWVRRSRCAACDQVVKAERARSLPTHQFSLSELLAVVGGAAILSGLLRTAITAVLNHSGFGR